MQKAPANYVNKSFRRNSTLRKRVGKGAFKVS